MDEWYWWVGTALAALFAVFTGFNDAGALVGVALRVRGLRPLAAVVLLGLAVLVAPALLGAAVAATLDHRLVAFDHTTGPFANAAGPRLPLLVGIAAAVLVTVVIAGRGLPTSLTLALVGGIAGAGVGTRTPVDWAVVAGVLAAAAAAPVVGALVALGACRLLAVLPFAARRLRWLHTAAYTATCVAYGANDGQKMLAVYAAVHGGTPHRYAASLPVLALIGGCFVLGALLGLPRLTAGVGGQIAPARADAVVATEFSGACVVLGTAAVGAPVSMTQSLSGALVGTGLSRGGRRVRWRGVLRLGRAWLVTLPAAFVAAAVSCAALSAAR